jgi:two-component system, chemotaxis family, chemotaxis protein CheY
MTEVLIVDDSPVVRKIARRVLEGMTLKASEAVGGSDALAVCSLAMPDAILIDGDMPGIDGCDLVKRFRRLPGGDRPKVVVCVSENDPARLARAIQAGADDFVIKPFDVGLLRSKFSSVVAR